jgi:endonuclease/exonuclease/phosphatase family metal-dependent hydrolase
MCLPTPAQKTPRGDLCHVLQEHEREVHLIADAIVREDIDLICFQEVGEHLHDHITRPYGFSESNMAFRIQKKIREMCGRHFHLFQDWSHIGFGRWREGTAILCRYPMYHCASPWVTRNKDTSHLASRQITMCHLEIPWFGWPHIVNAHMHRLEPGFKADFDYLKDKGRSLSRATEPRLTPDRAADSHNHSVVVATAKGRVRKRHLTRGACGVRIGAAETGNLHQYRRVAGGKTHNPALIFLDMPISRDI